MIWLPLETVGIFHRFLNCPFQRPVLWGRETAPASAGTEVAAGVDGASPGAPLLTVSVSLPLPDGRAVVAEALVDSGSCRDIISAESVKKARAPIERRSVSCPVFATDEKPAGGGPTEWQTPLLQLSVAPGCWEFYFFFCPRYALLSNHPGHALVSPARSGGLLGTETNLPSCG